MLHSFITVNRSAAENDALGNDFHARFVESRTVKMVQYVYRLQECGGGAVKKKDWLILGGVLLLAALAFLATRFLLPSASDADVTIYLHGEVYAKVSSDE